MKLKVAARILSLGLVEYWRKGKCPANKWNLDAEGDEVVYTAYTT